jgi:nucleotide-binding universal stress UspA family protein
LVELGMARSVMALGVKMPAPEPLVPSEEVGTAERRMHRKAHEENWFGQIATMVERWMQPIIAQGIGAEWLGVEGNAAPAIAKEGKRADAIVLGSRGLPGAELGQHLHAALFGAGAAALVLPPGHEGPIGDIVAIAWQDDGRAQRAVESALPILRQARQIHVLRAGPQARAAGSLPDVLASNRLAAQLHFVPARHEDTGQALLAAARGLGADLMVMGAYGHGEWREAMLGGVTRTMLAEADLPLLMRS